MKIKKRIEIRNKKRNKMKERNFGSLKRRMKINKKEEKRMRSVWLSSNKQSFK